MLDQIVAARWEDVAQDKEVLPVAKLEPLARKAPVPPEFTWALRKPGIALIAEFKRASPSKGELRADLDPAKMPVEYARNGAAAISVLTEEKHFQGTLDDMVQARDALREADLVRPILRKDFIFDYYQILEARCWGASAVLLIVAILKDYQLRDLMNQAKRFSMAAVVEVHNEEEAKRALAAGARIIGINNRDLRTFETDLETTKRLRPLIPSDRVVIAESGIQTADDVAKLAEWGVQGMLIGESIVTAKDIGAKVRELAEAGAKVAAAKA
jgi:indole-3-glycerol phosphate synthase